MTDQPPKVPLVAGEDYPKVESVGHLVRFGDEFDDTWIAADSVASVEVYHYSGNLQPRVIVYRVGDNDWVDWKPPEDYEGDALAAARAYARTLRVAIADAHPASAIAVATNELRDALTATRDDIVGELRRVASR